MIFGGSTAAKRTSSRFLWYGIVVSALLWAWLGGKYSPLGFSTSTHLSADAILDIPGFSRTEFSPRSFTQVRTNPPVLLGLTDELGSADGSALEPGGFTNFLPLATGRYHGKNRVMLRTRRWKPLGDSLTADDSMWQEVTNPTLFHVTGDLLFMDGLPASMLEFSALTRQSLGDWDKHGNALVGWVEAGRLILEAGVLDQNFDLDLQPSIFPQKFVTRHSGQVVDPLTNWAVVGALVEVTNPKGVVSGITDVNGMFHIQSRSGQSTIRVTKAGAETTEVATYDYRMEFHHQLELIGGSSKAQ